MDDAIKKGCLMVVVPIGLCLLTFFGWLGAVHWKWRYGKVDPQNEQIMTEAQAIWKIWAEKEEKRLAAKRETAQQRAARLKAEAEERNHTQAQQREEQLSAFTLRYAPAAWRTLQTLRAEAQTQREQLEAFKADIRIFGLQVSADENVQQLQAQLAETERRRDGLYEKLVEALLAERKAAAAIGRRGYERLRQRALEEGERRAEEAQRVFQGLRAQGVPAQ